MATYKSQYEKNPKTGLESRGTPTNLGLPTDIEKQTSATLALQKKKAACEAKGGTWDVATQTCVMPVEKQLENFKVDTQQQQIQPSAVPADQKTVDKKVTFNPDGTVTLEGADGNPITMSKEEYNSTMDRGGKLTQNVIEGRQIQNRAQVEAQELAGQVGQYGQMELMNQPLLNQEQAIKQGIVGAIPRALSLAVTGAGIGLAGGAAAGSVVPGAGTAAGAGAGAVIGAVGGFVSGITSSMISEYKGQRVDTINAQKRVLDEGKQTMKDWATLAESDPANRARYLSEYNKVSAQIDQAYRQMKLDTNRDVAKFETALPDLAEFEAFYAAGGERDTLDAEMRNALLTPVTAEYKMLELAKRRAQ